MKVMKIVALMFFVSLFFSLASCGKHDDYAMDGVNWEGDNGGTLELFNGSNKDIIIFVGQTPANSTMLGGVKAGATKKYDISRHVDDFDVGGYAIIRGVTKEEWDEDFDPSNAKIEFSAMVTYKRGSEYRYNIDANYMGDYGFRVVNSGKIGMELRKDSPNGEKVAYLPALQQNQIVYTQTSDAITLFPVYVFYNKKTGEVTSLEVTSSFESVMATPRPLTGDFQSYYFPVDQALTWEQIVGTLKSPAAYITISNGVPNQSAYITHALSNRLSSQSGYDAIASGEQLVFEVESTEEGTRKDLRAVFYNGNIQVPILFPGETEQPLIENGYNYSVSINYTAGEGGAANLDNYKAELKKGEKRDLTEQIESL